MDHLLRQGPLGETGTRDVLEVETRTSGGEKVLWWRQGLVVEERTSRETWSCGGDKDQWGDMVLWWRKGPVGRYGLVVETRTSGETWSCGRDKDQWGDMVLWWRHGPVGRQGLVVEIRTSGGDKVLW